MSIWILAAIDGTGSAGWRSADGGNSHVWKFHRDFGTTAERKRYFDGPRSVLGSDVGSIRASVRDWLLRTLRPLQAPRPGGYACILPSETLKICLVGHSRGGLIAVELAHELSTQGYPVWFMGLYDAVDMARGADGSLIANVATTYHAIRHPALGSRNSWGNTGRQDAAVYYEKSFLTTHGGIGGDPVLKPEGLWADYACDVRGLKAGIIALQGGNLGVMCKNQSAEADRWIRAGAIKEGLPVAAR